MTDRNGAIGVTYSFTDIFSAMATASQFEEVLNKTLAVSIRELAADQGSILLLEGQENPQLRMLAAVGLPEEIVRRGYVARKGSISEYVLREGRAVVVNDDDPPPGGMVFRPPPSDSGVRRRIVSALCVPLVARGRTLGTMNLNRTRGAEKFSEADVEASTS